MFEAKRKDKSKKTRKKERGSKEGFLISSPETDTAWRFSTVRRVKGPPGPAGEACALMTVAKRPLEWRGLLPAFCAAAAAQAEISHPHVSAALASWLLAEPYPVGLQGRTTACR